MSPQLDRLSAPRTRKGSRRRRRGVRLTNPLREICTVGSVREESPKRPDGPKRARSWKRRRQPRKVYSASGLLYSAAQHGNLLFNRNSECPKRLRIGKHELASSLDGDVRLLARV